MINDSFVVCVYDLKKQVLNEILVFNKKICNLFHFFWMSTFFYWCLNTILFCLDMQIGAIIVKKKYFLVIFILQI